MVEKEKAPKKAKEVKEIDGTETTTKRETPLSIRLDQLKKAIREGYRDVEFEDLNSEKRKVRVYLPSMKEDTLISDYKAKVTSHALKDENLMMREEVLANLRKRGVWDEEKEKRLKNLEKQMSETLNDIYMQKSRPEPDKERLQELRREKLSTEIDLAILREPKQSFEESTLENYIEREILKYKMCLLIRNEDGSPIWASLEDYNDSDNYNKHLVNSILSEAYYFWAGIDPALFDAAPTFE